QSRSHDSILREAELLTKMSDFKGYIHDIGGPTANFRRPSCDWQLEHGVCADRKCLTPKPCPRLIVDHSDYMSLLQKLRKIPGVKKVFVRSGVRFDYAMLDKNGKFFDELVRHHISGRLKIAPEHVNDAVLASMGKPGRKVYEDFRQEYGRLNEKAGLNQCLEPYFISSHPGGDLAAAVELAEYLLKNRIKPEQVQDFYPTPGTVSTCMYYTGVNPLTGESVHVPRNPREKAMQRALLQYGAPGNRELVIEALKITGRTDLIGVGKDKLVNWRERPDNKPAKAGNERAVSAGRRGRGVKK
ncbi:MAG: DUF3362 domain-containing protein, partial [Defluviitaleaceae bacterium]|nr:DUF3362 domain-containing protein [Defluviitaleaceae bacterium]